MVALPTLSPEEAYQTGQKPRKGIICDFQHAGRGMSPWEKEAALERFKVRGLAIGENPVNRLSFFDTDLVALKRGWDEETKQQVEERLLGGMSYGTDYFLVEKPSVPVPYANYLKHRKVQGRRTLDHAIADIVAAVTAAGIDPGAVIQYEREHDNASQVVEAMEALLNVESVEEETVVAA